MSERHYIIPYGFDARKRHYHETQRGSVTRFVVQLEVLVQDEWKSVVRYDCAHGFAHCDRFTIGGDQRKDILIDDQWEAYRDHFMSGEYP